MTISITHSTVATLPDESGAEVNKDQWNDEHDVSGVMELPTVRSVSTNDTAVLADANKIIVHAASDANARDFTIPSNISIPYPVGTSIKYINEPYVPVSVAVASDSLRLDGVGPTPRIYLHFQDSAVFTKTASTTWAAEPCRRVGYPAIILFNDNKADATFAFDDESGWNHTMTRLGDAQYDTAQAPTGMTSSVLFDGTTDAVTTTSHPAFHLPGDFTIEFMLRSNSLSAARAIVDMRSGTAGEGLMLYTDTTNFVVHCNNTPFLTATAGLSTGTWYHIAVTRANGVLTCWKDGAQMTAGSSLNTTIFPQNIFRIGTTVASAAGYIGWLSNFRIISGLALYQGPFTPPSLPLVV